MNTTQNVLILWKDLKLAINGSKPMLFSTNLLLVSQELFSKDYKKVYDIDIFGNFRSFVATFSFKDP